MPGRWPSVAVLGQYALTASSQPLSLSVLPMINEAACIGQQALTLQQSAVPNWFRKLILDYDNQSD